MKLTQILLEKLTPDSILSIFKERAVAFEDKLESYDDKELATAHSKLKRLIVSSATSPEKLLQNIADFMDDILDIVDKMEDPFPVLEALHPLKLFEFYVDFELIVKDLIEHIEGNIMYSRGHEASGVD